LKFLVTGASGLLGYGISEYLLEQGNDVIGTFNKNNSFIKNKNYTEIKVDIEKEDEIFSAYLNSVDVLVHCAYLTPSGMNNNNISNTEKNIKLGLRIIDFFLKSKCNRIVFISSASVYGENKKMISEDNYMKNDFLSAKYEYAAEKCFLEHILQKNISETKKEYIILRPTNIIGYYPDFINNKQLVPTIFRSIQNHISLEFDNANKHTRDFISSKDIGKAIYLLSKKDFDNETYTICSEINISIEALLEDVSKIFQKNVTYINNENDSKYIDLKYSCSKLKSKISWKPSASFGDEINNIYKRLYRFNNEQ